MAQRAQNCIAIATVAGCVLAGLAGIVVWSFLIGGLCLSLVSLWDQEKLRPRFVAVGTTSMLGMANLASIADGFLVSAAAWSLGAVFRVALQSV